MLIEETKNTVSTQSLKGRLGMTVCHQDNREVTRTVLMLLSLCVLANDSQSHQQRVEGFSAGEKDGGKEKQPQTGSQQRLPETQDTQRKPSTGMLMKRQVRRRAREMGESQGAEIGRSGSQKQGQESRRLSGAWVPGHL